MAAARVRQEGPQYHQNVSVGVRGPHESAPSFYPSMTTHPERSMHEFPKVDPDEEDSSLRKKRCADRYDSSESSDSGIAVSSSSSTTSSSDITDPGSPFSTTSEDSSSAKSPKSPPAEMPPNVAAPAFGNGAAVAAPAFGNGAAVAAPSFGNGAAVAPSVTSLSRRNAATLSSVVTRAKRRPTRRPSSTETQGKITEYFKTQIKPLVGIKRDFNYLKKELFVPDAKKPRDMVPVPVAPKPPDKSKFLAQKPSEPKTLFNKILQKHKHRKIVDGLLQKARSVKDFAKELKKPCLDTRPSKETTTTTMTTTTTTTATTTTTPPLTSAKQPTAKPRSPPPVTPRRSEVTCQTASSNLPPPPPPPPPSSNNRLRFPASQGGAKMLGDNRSKVTSAAISSGGRDVVCLWTGCERVWDSCSSLLDHLQNDHVLSQGTGEKFVCHWVGCKVFDQKSCSRSWLERHVLTHAGSKPYRCIVEGCGQGFSTQSMLQRHVNHHFSVDGKKPLEIVSGQKLIRRNGKRMRYRSQPFSARSRDYMDMGIMEMIEHKIITMTRILTGGAAWDTPRDCINLTSEVLAKRRTLNGTEEYLLTWSPPDLVDDEWVPVSQYRTHQTFSLNKLKPDAQARLETMLGITPRRRRGRKWRRPPSVETPETSTDSTTTESVPTEDEKILGPPPAIDSIKAKTRRKRVGVKSPIDPDKLPTAKVPIVDIAKLPPLTTVNNTATKTEDQPTINPQQPFIISSVSNQQYKLVTQPFLNTSLVPSVTYQIPSPIIPQNLYFLPPPQPAPLLQTIHISSNLIQQQSILTNLNLNKSQPTLLLLNSTKQVSLSHTVTNTNLGPMTGVLAPGLHAAAAAATTKQKILPKPDASNNLMTVSPPS